LDREKNSLQDKLHFQFQYTNFGQLSLKKVESAVYDEIWILFNLNARI
jgi:hypothetical protein